MNKKTGAYVGEPSVTRQTTSAGDETRRALLDAGLALFSVHGYDGASSRALAKQANTNQALISYHFGNKRGLYLAVFDMIADNDRQHTAAMFEALDKRVEQTSLNPIEKRGAAIEAIVTLLISHVRLMTEPAMESVARLVLRELHSRNDAFERIYDGVLVHRFERLVRYVQIAEGDDPDQAASVDHCLRALTLFGQAFVFRGARAVLQRSLNCTTLGSSRVDAIETILTENVESIFRQNDS